MGPSSCLAAEPAVPITSFATTSDSLRSIYMVLMRNYVSNPTGLEEVFTTAMALRSIMSEGYNGQHLETAKALCDGSTTSAWEAIMTQLFLLANNFTENGKLNPEERTRCHDMRAHDERVVNMLHQIRNHSSQRIRQLLSAQYPTAEAVKEQVFASAMRLEDPVMLKFILSIGVDVDTAIEPDKGSGHFSPLYLAARIKDAKKSLEIVTLLMDAGAKVNVRQLWVLQPALRNGNVHVLRKMIENLNGARISEDLLGYAVKTGSHEIVQMILDAGADVNESFCRIGFEIRTPVGIAAHLGHFEIARTLIGRGADINADQKMKCILSSGCASPSLWHKSETHTTALGAAISQGHLEIAHLLLDQPDVEINRLSANRSICPLLVACDQGHDDIITRLLHAGADVRAADMSGVALICKRTTVLSAWIRRRRGKINMTLCEVIISKGARLDYALVEAARSNTKELVKFLLNRGAASKEPGGGPHQTALGCCIEEGLVDMAQFIFDSGQVDPGIPTQIKHGAMVQYLRRNGLLSDILHANGPMIVCNAIRGGSGALLKELITHDDDIDFSRGSGSSSLLDVAIDFGSPKLIAYLLDRGAKFGRWTLRHAVRHERAKEFLDTLLATIPPFWSHNAIEPEPGWLSEDYLDSEDLGRDEHSPPAIICAAYLGDPSLLQRLLSVVDWGSRRMGVALTAAILSCKSEAVQILLRAGASLHEAWSLDDSLPDRESALAAAVEVEDIELTVALIKAGANVNKPAGDRLGQRTALQLAAELGNLKLVDILLGAGANVNAPPGELGVDALQCAAIGGYLEIAHRLLCAGAEVNADRAEDTPYFDDIGRTALEGAAEHGRLEMVHLLLEKGARLKGTYTDQYRRSVELANENGHHAVAKYIESVHRSRAEPDDSDDDDDYLSDSDSSAGDEERDIQEVPSPPVGVNVEESQATDEFGGTDQDVAAQSLSWDIDMAESLVGADTNGCGWNPNSPLVGVDVEENQVTDELLGTDQDVAAQPLSWDSDIDMTESLVGADTDGDGWDPESTVVSDFGY
jgi:ankyrin repeat protein